MSESGIQTAVQATIRAIADFSNADVVINDDSILDQSTELSPYVVILNSDNFISRQDIQAADTTWNIPVMLVVRFWDWKTSRDQLRDYRQALINKFNEVGTARAPGGDGTQLVSADVIRNEGPVVFLYDNWRDPEPRGNDLPNYLAQVLIFEVREW